jgi:alpha-glucosidase
MNWRIHPAFLCASAALAGVLAWPAAKADFVEPPPMTVHLDANGITIDNGTGTGTAGVGAPLAIHFDGAGILHVQTGVPAAQPALVLDPHPESMHASVSVKMSEDKRSVTMTSERLVATWSRNSTLSIDDASGRHLLTLYLLGLGDNRLGFMHAVGDALYGIHGYDKDENASAGLLRNGTQVAKAGEQGYAGAPFVWSTAGYGVLVDTDRNVDFKETLPAGKPDADPQLAWLAIEPETGTATAQPATRSLDFYILAGEPRELFGELASLSGHAPLFPKWANGFINSQWGIDEKEFRQIVATYRAKHIPLDGFTFDFDWKAWGDDWGEFSWNAKKFPDGPSGKLKADMDRLGVHMTGIMKPRVHIDTVEGRYATAHDLWLPGEEASPDYFSHKPVKDIDFDKPASRAWFFNDALGHSFDTGIVGWWNDEADNTPSNTQFLNMQRSLYDGQRARSDLRVWSINRDFWLGAQRYAYGLWSGDIDTGFASMAAQRQRMLSAINVGEMLWGMDGGGFNGHPSDENYARWIEFGAFTPIFRVHGSFNEKRQPWVYGPVAEAAAAQAMRLRYALIPYIYAYQHRNHVAGIGLVQPLLFAWPHNPQLRNDTSAWLFGDWLLVSPVVQQGQTIKHIYLPAGRWIDWFSGKAYAGGQTIDYPVDARRWSDIPLFIRQGAIIPTQPAMDYVGQQPVTQLDVEVFPDTQRSTFDYYDDDGSTYDYEHGAYFSQSLSVQQQGHAVHFETTAPAGSFKPALKFYLLKIHGDAAAGVTSADGAMPSFADLDALQKNQGEGWASGHDRYGTVTWVRVSAAAGRHITLTTKS